SLDKPEHIRAGDFNDFAQDSADRLTILNDLATVYDQRKKLRNEIDRLYSQLQDTEQKLVDAGLDTEQLKISRDKWYKLEEKEQSDALLEFLGSENDLDLLKAYVNSYAQWAELTEELTEPLTGINAQYQSAKKTLDELNLSREQVEFVLEIDPKSTKASMAIEQLKADFPMRAAQIDKVVAAFDEYRPYRGRLDDSKDLQRMLKGAGILEFRILPTIGADDLSAEQIQQYVELLRTKGPKYASDNKYKWLEAEDGESFKAADEQQRPAIVGQFGQKYYVLTSNKADEIMLQSTERKWKLTNARPTQDQQGRRAIGFAFDEIGARIFGKITGNNIGRPLCILLDDLTISAPNIQSRITSQGIITGTFSQTEQLDMVNKLNAGSLPARLIEQPISVKTIGPSIGADNRDKGIKAGLIGLVLVILCMAVYYTLAGAIADLALLMNLLFVLAVMALVRATFTLPGIAGLILTIGMSVDANVLIFERIREEQQKGSSLRVAIRNGYQKAFRTILDANLTTFITAAILLWVASEEVKGFAIVLMLGIVSSMFTALFVTRVIFDLLLSKKLIKEHLVMLRIIHRPNINWMALRPIFLTISAVLIAVGLTVFFTRDEAANSKYDIEFTGGTSVQINLKENVNLTREDVEKRIRSTAEQLGNPALQAANVYSVGKSGRQYEINTTETNKLAAVVTFRNNPQTTDTILSAIGDRLSNLTVTSENNPHSFRITTSQTSKSLVREVLEKAFPGAGVSEPDIEEVVNKVVLQAFEDNLEIRQNLQPAITSAEKITHQLIDSQPELADFLGGVKISCEVRKPATIEEIKARVADMRFKPDVRELDWYQYKILGPDLKAVEPERAINSFVYVSSQPEATFSQLSDEDWERFVNNERTKVLAAAELEASLPRVKQINPSVGAEAKTRALIAIVLSLFAIVSYIWVRFGNIRYGVAAIIALVHDVCITLGAVVTCTYLAQTVIGEKLLIEDFKINLAMIAAFLTLIGYSLNDTIVVFDRIRENRKKALLNPRIVTDSINQTISRTLLTSFTTFIVVLIMYIFGGSGLRGFTFAIGFGIIVGTYSSIAIAAPTLLFGAQTAQPNRVK
ncbi:MAG: protein translocase subunit SecD, partial [Sedimentisphaerales bacterium]|nr:protein translocase subunit SecD [Sedimentisphaerales bacterium]